MIPDAGPSFQTLPMHSITAGRAKAPGLEGADASLLSHVKGVKPLNFFWGRGCAFLKGFLGGFYKGMQGYL